MKLKIIIPLLCACSLHALAQKPIIENDRRFKGLDTTFQHVLKTWNTAGFAVAVIQKNKVIYAKGFGYRDVAAKLPVTANTLFAIGSCSKAFTTTLIGQLEKNGRLDIDKPVNNYLPSLKFYNETMNAGITLRDMMSHRTGLPRFDLSWYFFNTPSVDSMVQRIRYMEPVAGLREKWQYNNFMYAAQGAVIKKLTGKSWEDNIRENIFVPLGMTRSNASIPEMEKSDEISRGYTVNENGNIKEMPYYHIGGMAPAGAINSNVNDMAKWVMTWINNGKYNGKEVIPEDFRNAAISSQAIIDGSLPGKQHPGTYFSNYGFGWFVDSYEGHYRVEHGGNIDGFTAIASFFPSDSLGIVVLSNQQNSKVPVLVRNLVADRILHLPYRDWNSELKSAYDKANRNNDEDRGNKTAAEEHAPATHPLTEFAGSYTHPAYGTMNLFAAHDSLFAQTVTHTLWLRHSNCDTFEIFDKDPENGIDTARVFGIDIQFHMNPAGGIDGFESRLEEGLKPMLFVREPALKPRDAAE